MFILLYNNNNNNNYYFFFLLASSHMVDAEWKFAKLDMQNASFPTWTYVMSLF